MTNFAALRPLTPAPIADTGPTPPAQPPAPEAPTPTPEPPESTPAAPTPGERLTTALASLRWSQGLLATTLRLSPSTVRHWAADRARPPTELLLWLERLAAHHDADPPPSLTIRPGNPDWRTS